MLLRGTDQLVFHSTHRMKKKSHEKSTDSTVSCCNAKIDVHVDCRSWNREYSMKQIVALG